MEKLRSTLNPRGVPHQAAAPTLEMAAVSVAYAAGGEGVTTARSDSYALERVSCTIQRGEFVAVVGPNGAGKSTFLKLLVGTVRPSEGEVRIFGLQPAGHICIGYVPQRNQIDWAFPVTVEDVVMMGRVGQIGLLRWPRQRDWERVRSSLARAQAGHLAHVQIGELSGGQQQRVFIARALAQEAELLLLDEPLTGLDIRSQEGILDILEGLRREGVTVVVATHDLNLAAERFDRVMLLNRHIIAFGPPEEVLTTSNLLQAYGARIGDAAGPADGEMAEADKTDEP